jgi:hypothetical protein
MNDFIDDMVVEKCRMLFEDVRHVPMTNSEYHANHYKSLSKTRLTVFKDDPQEFYQRWVTGEIEDHDTDALCFGRIFHEMVLEKVGTVTEETWKSNTLGVFRLYRAPKREPDIKTGSEEIWIETMPQPGIIRRSAEWGDLDDRCWTLRPRESGVVTAFCAFADMHENGKLFVHVPEYVLSDSGAKQGKPWLTFKEKHKGRTLYKADQWYSALSMRRRLRQHGDANRCLFQGGFAEYTLVGKCVETGLEVRTRLDFYKPIDGGTLITDLKTSRDAEPDAWNRQADQDGLNMQAAMVIGMASHVFEGGIAFRFATCDKRAPFRPETFEIENEFLELGAKDYLETARDFQRCCDTGRWFHADFGNPQRLVTPSKKMVKWM